MMLTQTNSDDSRCNDGSDGDDGIKSTFEQQRSNKVNKYSQLRTISQVYLNTIDSFILS